MHENNRQMIVEADLLTVTKPLLKCQESFLLKEVCCLYRYLVLDDDIRVEFGKAHEHARLIAGEALEEITRLLDSEEEHFHFQSNFKHSNSLPISFQSARRKWT